MTFKAGDHVMLASMFEVVELLSEPWRASDVESGGSKIAIVGHLASGETAVIVSVERHDCRSVYIVGPHGSGWTLGGYLRHVP